jgi:hypothetical protein
MNHEQNSSSLSPPFQIEGGVDGAIADPHPNDVLCGRGGRINSHEGNVKFREIVNALKPLYLSQTTKKAEKAVIAAEVVARIRSLDPPGRFLKETNKEGVWVEISDEKARKKAGQALREDAPDLRAEMLSANDNRGGDAPSTNKVSPLSPAAAGLGMIQQPQIANYSPGDCIIQPIIAAPPQFTPNPFLSMSGSNGVYDPTSFQQYHPQIIMNPHQQVQAYLQPALQQPLWGYTQIMSQGSPFIMPQDFVPQFQLQQQQQQQQNAAAASLQQIPIPPPSANRKNILNKFFTENEQQQQHQQLLQKQTKYASKGRNRSSSSTIHSSMNSAASSALEYLDNVSLTSSGNWVRSTKADDIISAASHTQCEEISSGQRLEVQNKVLSLSQSENNRSNYVYKDKDRLSPIGDTGQEENITSDGGNVDLLKSTEDPVSDDLAVFDNAMLKTLYSEFSSGVKRSNSFPNFSTLSISDFDMFSVGDSAAGEDIPSVNNRHRQSLAGSLRRDVRVGRQEVGSGISALSFNSSALSSNVNASSWNYSETPLDGIISNPSPDAKLSARRTHRNRLNSAASTSGGLFSVIGSDDEECETRSDALSDAMSNASSWLRPFKPLSTTNNEKNEQFNSWQVESNRSILSDMSVDLLALDLASNPETTFASYRAAAQRYHQQQQR